MLMSEFETIIDLGSKNLRIGIFNSKYEGIYFASQKIECDQDNKNLQNIDLMNLAGFCRNCISKWYSESSKDYGNGVNYDDAKEIIYNMPYSEWKEKYQK